METHFFRLDSTYSSLHPLMLQLTRITKNYSFFRLAGDTLKNPFDHFALRAYTLTAEDNLYRQHGEHEHPDRELTAAQKLRSEDWNRIAQTEPLAVDFLVGVRSDRQLRAMRTQKLL